MLLYPTHSPQSSSIPPENIPLSDDDKESYLALSSKSQKIERWLNMFASHARYVPTSQPMNFQRLKKTWAGVENNIEDFIPHILASYSGRHLNDFFDTTPAEKQEIFRLLDIYIAHLTDEQVHQECAMIRQFDEKRTAKEVIEALQFGKKRTQQEDKILDLRTKKQKEYISRGVIISYDSKNGKFASCQNFWNEEFLDEAKKGNLPITWSEFVEIWSFLDKNLEQYIPGIIEYLHKNGYKKRLEDVFMLTPKEREDLTNMFTFGYQMQDTQTGILERVRRLLPFK